eukprot:3333494-Pyramimonas_sp.AAC.1
MARIRWRLPRAKLALIGGILVASKSLATQRRSWSTTRSTEQCIQLCQQVDQILINSVAEDADEEIQLSVNSAVECLRAAQYVMDPDPLNFRFASDFDAVTAAEPISESQWKGLRYLFNERMCETTTFASNVTSIKRTKVRGAMGWMETSRGGFIPDLEGGPSLTAGRGGRLVGWWLGRVG